MVLKSPIPEKYVVPSVLALNVFSSIGIVYVNKSIFMDYAFPFGMLLTVIHFIVTFLLLVVCLILGVFEFKRVPVWRIIPLCISFCGFVALTNMSLVYNPVGFYQLMKVLTTPLLVVLQTVVYGQPFSIKIKLLLTVICVGVAIGTVSDASANIIGTMIALSALLVTCQYQIWVGTKQKELNCNSFQLLLYQAPISALMLLPVSIFADDLRNNFYWPCTDTMIAILISGGLAFLVNISIFLVIGKTSPVTYNVLGHTKLCCILSLGFLFFGEPFTQKTAISIAITLTGVFLYTHLKQRENERKAALEAKADTASPREGGPIAFSAIVVEHDDSDGDGKPGKAL